jgi:hypothetical protein
MRSLTELELAKLRQDSLLEAAVRSHPARRLLADNTLSPAPRASRIARSALAALQLRSTRRWPRRKVVNQSFQRRNEQTASFDQEQFQRPARTRREEFQSGVRDAEAERKSARASSWTSEPSGTCDVEHSVGADPGLSPRHARATVTPMGVAIENPGSTNGTFVNGARMAGPQRLAADDRIAVGDSLIEVHAEAVPGDATAMHHTHTAAAARMNHNSTERSYKTAFSNGRVLLEQRHFDDALAAVHEAEQFDPARAGAYYAGVDPLSWTLGRLARLAWARMPTCRDPVRRTRRSFADRRSS